MKNAVYCLEISTLVLEIFKFEKYECVKHVTQCNINYINRAILVNNI